ncbi:MAG: phage terminase large subunit, partial [Lactobacillus sp.]|nr:phage terminase large subunit [Lactobacillus sp.]
MNNRLSFYEFSFIWLKMQGLTLPKHQRKIIKWLEKIYFSKSRQALLMAFRNSGKSTIVGLFCAWVLYFDNAGRILVIAADYSLAKKMVRNVKRIIERHPLTKGLKPDKLDQWASDQFTINRQAELRDPSMLAKGLNANLTGLRADIIICDDVEVPKNSDSAFKRNEMREKLQELDYILTPSGMQLYIGTPHTFYTIYQTDYDDSKKEVEPFLYKFNKLEVPILNKKNQSVWPERFSEEKIASIRSRSGENKFLSQMMLIPVNIAESILDPARLKSYSGCLELVFSNNREFLKLGERRMVSASCWWDPSFGSPDKKSDNSVIA